MLSKKEDNAEREKMERELKSGYITVQRRMNGSFGDDDCKKREGGKC